jgi:hypothetical protein
MTSAIFRRHARAGGAIVIKDHPQIFTVAPVMRTRAEGSPLSVKNHDQGFFVPVNLVAPGKVRKKHTIALLAGQGEAVSGSFT